MSGYMVYAFYCDECQVKMPVVADAATGGDAQSFVKSELERHNRIHH